MNPLLVVAAHVALLMFLSSLAPANAQTLPVAQPIEATLDYVVVGPFCSGSFCKYEQTTQCGLVAQRLRSDPIDESLDPLVVPKRFVDYFAGQLRLVEGVLTGFGQHMTHQQAMACSAFQLDADKYDAKGYPVSVDSPDGG